MQPVVRVDADQMGVECSMMDFWERDAVWNHWLTEPLVLIRDNVRGVQQ
jgi:hypothetical protein